MIDEMIQELFQDMTNNVAGKDVYKNLCNRLDIDLRNDHERRIFLSGFLNQYEAIQDKNIRYNLRLQYAKTIEKADNELKALREKPGSYQESSDETSVTNKIIKVAIDGRKVQKKNKTKAREYLKFYAVEKKRNPGLSIDGYISEIGKTEFSDNTYRNWIGHFDKAESMLLDAE